MPEKVLVASASNYSVTKYHLPGDDDPTEPLCGNSGSEHRSYRRVERDHPAARDRRVCETCRTRSEGADGQSEPPEAECPFCGADVGHLPPHLPCDGAAGAAEVLSDGE